MLLSTQDMSGSFYTCSMSVLSLFTPFLIVGAFGRERPNDNIAEAFILLFINWPVLFGGMWLAGQIALIKKSTTMLLCHIKYVRSDYHFCRLFPLKSTKYNKRT
ncbi:MAG: hypothetical protein HQK78_17695 [Desulfobacterales bacterium]|nr:hypothetical protein [Desulfobacterales bacterium]